MTDRTKALDELIAGDADLYDVVVTQEEILNLIAAYGGRIDPRDFISVMKSSHSEEVVIEGFQRALERGKITLDADGMLVAIASARITGDKDRRVSQSSAPTGDAKIKALVEAVREIAEPIAAMQKRAKDQGCQLDGGMAVYMANSASHLSGIAREALAAFEGDV